MLQVFFWILKESISYISKTHFEFQMSQISIGGGVNTSPSMWNALLNYDFGFLIACSRPVCIFE
jgi:hypothetical protein